MREIHTEIEIHAPAERVWRVLTDFAGYPQWNPFIRRVEGELEAGARLDVFIQPPGGKGMSFRPTVLSVEPGRGFRWLGNLWVPGLFDGEHSFAIEPFGADHVRLIQSERFGGLFPMLLTKMLERDVRRGFEEMNRALKTRSESAT